MDSNAPISSSSLADANERLAESIHTTSFLLRQLNNRKLKFNECAPIFAAVQEEMQSAVKELKITVNLMTDDVSRMNGHSFLDRVDGVVTDMPRFVGILEKVKRGSPESDHYTVKFLEQFTQLGTGFAAIANASKSNNKM
ncbi:hypothetical protein HA402_005520 [Bradysia odoriphaga]|nr:hypothetical protein HA402_005520 [Bradysia odoriphaga]